MATAEKDIQRNILPLETSIKNAMRRLDEGVGGVLFVVDSDNIMQGMMTDGDVRRALLSGAGMADPIGSFINRNFTHGSVNMTREQNLSLLGPTIRHMPILDDVGQPVDMLSWVDMWKLPVAEPSLAGNEMKYVSDCISTVWISSQGGYINKFQDAFSQFMGDGFAQCTSSGTTALHLALRALDIGQGDEVIVPDVTFGATANVVIHAGATPIFVDIDPLTWTMDPKAFAAAVTKKTKAVIPVHLYGHPCDMDPIMETARLHNIKVIEDCAESLGAEYKGQKVGLIGDVGCFSFFANKVITTGEGGMTLTKDAALHERMALLRDHGMSKTRRYWHLEAGFNYRMTNLQAALGLAQMERIDHFLEARRNVVNHYNKNLSQLPGITTPLEADWAKNIYWLYSIEIDPVAAGIDRDRLAIKLMEAGVETRPVFPPLHVQPAYGSGKYGTHPVAERFAERGMSLPTSNALTVEEAEKVCLALTKILSEEQSLKTIRNVI